MKKLISTLVLAACSPSLMAQDVNKLPFTLVMGNSFSFTQICLAATESGDEREAVRIKHNFTREELAEVRCNNRTLAQFARHYRSVNSRQFREVSMKPWMTVRKHNCAWLH